MVTMTPDRWTARFRGRRGFSTGTSSSIGALPLSLPRLLERLFMQIPLQISFENAEPSEAVDNLYKASAALVEELRQ